MSIKTTVIANFNCTFGVEDKPMMEYFDNVIYPAFMSRFKRRTSSESLFFENVEIRHDINGRYMLCGILVRKTTIEIRTEHNDIKGITSTNKVYDSAPISFFTIYLDNHRMIYTTNQKGSPNIRAFGATVKSVIRQFFKNANLEREEKIPYPNIDVVSIPSVKNIKAQLEEVEKIKKLRIKLFAPNGDIDMSNIFRDLTNQLTEIGSKTGIVVYNSPSNNENVIDTIDSTKGVAEAALDVKYKNGGTGTIEHDKMTEKFKMEFEDSVPIEIIQNIAIDTYSKNDVIQNVSEENRKIFEQNKSKVINLFDYQRGK